jgi:hypothetical protein
VNERPAVEVADVLRDCGPRFVAQFGSVLTPEQRRAVRDLAACRTAALGGHVELCDHCAERRVAYNSCRNRHRPKCRGTRTARWLKREAAHVLPVEYFHVVFTLPEDVAAVALQNPRAVYGLLFEASWETIRDVAANPKHLGAEVGMLAALHTWGQSLQHHPHVHCVVTGGGLARDATGELTTPRRWRGCRPGFFLPVRVLSRVFRGKFLAGLRRLFAAGQLRFFGACSGLADAPAFGGWLRPLYAREWVVYAKPPFGGPEIVLKYLARYTHRVAISNRRLVSWADGVVTFTGKDYAHGGRTRAHRLSGTEFVRRFLQHVLPRGFVKIRRYGLLANRLRQKKLAVCRWLLSATAAPVAEPDVRTPRLCPVCGCGRLIVIEELTAAPRSGCGWRCDSSWGRASNHGAASPSEESARTGIGGWNEPLGGAEGASGAVIAHRRSCDHGGSETENRCGTRNREFGTELKPHR